MQTDSYLFDFAAAYIRWRRKIVIIAVAIVAVSAVLFLMTHDWFSLIWIFLILFGLAWIPAVRRYVSMLSITAEASRNFAQANDMRYVDSAKPNYQKHFLPAIARVGWFERHEQQIRTMLDGRQFDTYVATFRRPFSRQISRIATRVYCIHLPKELPHIVMLNRKSGNRYLGTLPRHFDDDQRIGLEGNFDEYFTTYTHRRTVTEALSILAPTFLETLRDANQAFDVEFIGSRMYLYTGDYFMGPDELKSAVTTIEKLMKHVSHRLVSWKFVLPNNQHFPYMSSRPGYGTIMLGGKYYSQAWLAIAGYNVYAALQILLNPVFFELKLSLVIFFNIVLIVTLLVFRRKYQLSRRNVAR